LIAPGKNGSGLRQRKIINAAAGSATLRGGAFSSPGESAKRSNN